MLRLCRCYRFGCFLVGNKKAALLKLKHKKMYEKEALKLESATIQMEQQMLSLESMYTNQEIVGVMQEGTFKACFK